MSFFITGRVFDVIVVKDYVANIVLKKRVREKGKYIQMPIAFTVLGQIKKYAIDELKIRAKDKIWCNFILKSNLYKGRYFTEAIITEIGIESKPITGQNNNGNEFEFAEIGNSFVDEVTGKVLLA